MTIRNKVLEFLNSDTQPTDYANVLLESRLIVGKAVLYTPSPLTPEKCDEIGCTLKPQYLIPEVYGGKVAKDNNGSIIVSVRCKMHVVAMSCPDHGIPFLASVCDNCKRGVPRTVAKETFPILQKPSAKKRTITCSRCGQPGHNARTCSTPKRNKYIGLGP